MQHLPLLRWHSGTAGRGWSRYALLAAILISASLSSAAAQGTAPGPASAPQGAAAPGDALKQREQELEAARLQQKNAAEQQARLKAEIAAIGEVRSKLNQQLIDIATRVRDVETRVEGTEERLRVLDAREQQMRGSLDAHRSEIVEVLAALQRAGASGAARGRAAIAAYRDAARCGRTGVADAGRSAGRRARRACQSPQDHHRRARSPGRRP